MKRSSVLKTLMVWLILITSGTIALSWGASPPPASIDLATLTSSQGFKFTGYFPYVYSGWSVAIAGDVNGDGRADVIIGAPYADPLGLVNAGQSYVVFGGSTLPELTPALLDGTNGFVMNGETAGGMLGYSVAAAGDVNGDGLGDLVVSAPNFVPNAGGALRGKIYVIFGTRTFPAVLNMAQLNGSNGFTILGEADGSACGDHVASAGDLNGDSLADLIVGAPQKSVHGDHSGRSYLVFGSRTPLASLDVAELDGSNGFAMNGFAAGDHFGDSVAGIGDINGDGNVDVAVGAPYASPIGTASGEVYVVFGGQSYPAVMEISSLNGSNGFTIAGAMSNDWTGWSIAKAGDFNQDGLADIAIGAPYASRNGLNASGQSIIVYGRHSFPTVMQLAGLTATDVLLVSGRATGDMAGYSLAGAGDTNKDGRHDLLVGSAYASPAGQYSGQSAVVFGDQSPPGAVDLAGLDGLNGYLLNGRAAIDLAGYSVGGGGDIDGDRVDDLVIGAPYATIGTGPRKGQSYVVYGVAHDSDSDGTPEWVDNCPSVANPGQLDSNHDGYGDACVAPDVVIPPTARIGIDPVIGTGTVIGTGVTLGDHVRIGDGVIVDKYSTVETATVIGDDVMIAQGVILGASITVGSHTQIDRGAVIGDRVVIGAWCLIGRDAMVMADAVMPDGTTVGGRQVYP